MSVVDVDQRSRQAVQPGAEAPRTIDLSESTVGTRVGGSLLRPLRDFAAQATRLPDRMSRIASTSHDQFDELYLSHIVGVGVHAVAAYEAAQRIHASSKVARDSQEWVQLCEQLRQESNECREALEWFLSVLDTVRRVESLRADIAALEEAKNDVRRQKSMRKRHKREQLADVKYALKSTETDLNEALARRAALAPELQADQMDRLGSTAERLLAAELVELAERSDALALAVKRTSPWETQLLSISHLIAPVAAADTDETEHHAQAVDDAQKARTVAVKEKTHWWQWIQM